MRIMSANLNKLGIIHFLFDAAIVLIDKSGYERDDLNNSKPF